MSLLKVLEATLVFCALCGVGNWALTKWSKAPEPETNKKPFKPMRPVKGVELDEYEEALGGQELKVADNQRN